MGGLVMPDGTAPFTWTLSPEALAEAKRLGLAENKLALDWASMVSESEYQLSRLRNFKPKFVARMMRSATPSPKPSPPKARA